MENVRTYGNPPFRTVVVHGGPGAPGYMAPVARHLSNYCGVLEPLQSATTLDGQIEELANQIFEHAETPCVVIGSSWGANLSLFLASHHPELVKKVVMIGSSVFDAESSNKVKEIRAARMSESDSDRSDKLMMELGEAQSEIRKNEIFEQLADCLFESDTFDPDTRDLEIFECQYTVNKSVWADFKVLRDQPGKLAEIHSRIECPVVNVHGDHDPHIIEGIQPFLESCLKGVTLHWLEKCGHYPWIEKQAKDNFFNILFEELKESKVVSFIPHTEEQIQKNNVGEAKPINSKIHLEEYDSRWPEEYCAIEAKVREALTDLSIEVHHVGSTSVPGLAAKPIIDIVLEVPDSTAENQYVPQLEACGFWLKIREPHWFEHRMFKAHLCQVNLHVFTKGCSEVGKMIAFRDHLASNKDDFELYLGKKRELAQRVWKYTQNYADAKSAVVKDIFTRVQI